MFINMKGPSTMCQVPRTMTDTIQTPIGTIRVGVTVLEGERMYGDRMAGVVRKIIPGVGFVIDNGVLFRSFTTATAAAAAEIQMQGLRCGFDPLPVGYPDCDFWSAVDGADALYAATEYDYGEADTPPSPSEMLTFLNQVCLDAHLVGGATLAAWNRQRDFVKEMHLSPDLVGVAGRRLGYVAHPGISHGFARPDPVLTRQETRRYLMEEFKQYMEGRIQAEAVRLAVVSDMIDDATIDRGFFPAGRLYRLLGRFERAMLLQAGSLDEQIRYVARWVVRVVTRHLADLDTVITSLESEALAFWKVDRLAGFQTIDSFWNHSPFEALRAAPPLSPGVEDDDADTDTVTEEAEEEEDEDEDEEDDDSEWSGCDEEEDEEEEEEDEEEEEEEEEEEDEEEEEEEEDRLRQQPGTAEEVEYVETPHTSTSLPLWAPMALSVIITVILAILCSKR